MSTSEPQSLFSISQGRIFKLNLHDDETLYIINIK